MLVLERWIDRQGRPTFEVRLPKGHVEPGETDEEAALREVCEESGVCGLEVVADLGSFTSEFILRDEQVIRDEHYYLMRLPPAHEPLAVRSPEPQSAAEALFERKWLPDLAEAESAITFASEQEFVRRARAVVDRSPHLAS